MSSDKPPIIDVHLHAFKMEGLVSPNTVEPSNNLKAPSDETQYMNETLSMLKQNNTIAVTSGPKEIVTKWKQKAPHSIIPGTLIYDPKAFDISKLETEVINEGVKVLCEIIAQPYGYSPSDPALDPYYELAVEHDIPVGIHIGPTWPGIAYMGATKAKGTLYNPLLIEDALIRHPDARVYICHAGWPMINEMINVLYNHPHVFVDLAVIDWFIPKKEFHYYLERLVGAGFCDRIMYGSDQMVWVDAMRISIENIEAAPFLTEPQKRDIFYNNAKRFLKL